MNVFLGILLTIGAIVIISIGIWALEDGDEVAVFIFALVSGVILFCVGIAMCCVEASDSEESINNKCSEVIEKLEINPFDKDVLLEAAKINYEIEKANISSDGVYLGMEPINYKEIQAKYVVENYRDQIYDWIDEEKVNVVDKNNPNMDSEIVELEKDNGNKTKDSISADVLWDFLSPAIEESIEEEKDNMSEGDLEKLEMLKDSFMDFINGEIG